jgi:hypothetical protein
MPELRLVKEDHTGGKKAGENGKRDKTGSGGYQCGGQAKDT